MFETIENTNSQEEAVQALQELLFKEEVVPEAIETSLQTRSGEFPIRDWVDLAAKRTLPHLYFHHSDNNKKFPQVFDNWKGDFRENTEKIYEIEKMDFDERPTQVQEYQTWMRNQLPEKIPLVRGIEESNSQDHPLTSWTAKVGTAMLYGDYILYTVVEPSDVFMCSLYGNNIGEQEFVLTDYEIQEKFEPTIENQLFIYQEMSKILRN